MEIREAIISDLSNGLLDSLKSLSNPQLTPEEAVGVYWQVASKSRIYVAVISDKVVGTASLLVETKFLHCGGKVGHIEDVAVQKEYQGQGIGQALIEHLVKVGMSFGCYKLILDCNLDLIPFYEKVGFRQWCQAMRFDL